MYTYINMFRRLIPNHRGVTVTLFKNVLFCSRRCVTLYSAAEHMSSQTAFITSGSANQVSLFISLHSKLPSPITYGVWHAGVGGGGGGGEGRMVRNVRAIISQ